MEADMEEDIKIDMEERELNDGTSTSLVEVSP